MIIRFERSGGFAGLPLRLTIDTEHLDPEEGELLVALVDSSQFFELPDKIRPERVIVDRFQYRVTISDPDRTHSVDIIEEGISEELNHLLQHLSYLARMARPGD